jgi:multiple sugar transport system ATP-binding protein
LPTATSAKDGQPVTLGLRPEHLTLGEGGLAAEIAVVEPTGPEVQVNARLASGEEIVAMFRERHPFRPGDKISLKPLGNQVHLFDGASGKRL